MNIKHKNIEIYSRPGVAYFHDTSGGVRGTVSCRSVEGDAIFGHVSHCFEMGEYREVTEAEYDGFRDSLDEEELQEQSALGEGREKAESVRAVCSDSSPFTLIVLAFVITWGFALIIIATS